MSDFPLQFEQPGWLVLLLLIIPAFLIARRGIASQAKVKALLAFTLRLIVILLLTTALTHPNWEKRGEGITVTVILDRSFSIPQPLKDSALDLLNQAVAVPGARQPEDRLACVTVAREATITAMPDHYSVLTAGDLEGDRTATNLAAGLRLAMAIAPDDTANRFLLVSDGNETEDSLRAAAELAKANNIPIDVMILEYDHSREVIFERLSAPARARLGQTVNLRLALRSKGESSGTVYLRMNGEPLDLSPDQPGHGRRVTLKPGVEVIPISLRLDQHGPAQFEAVFEPDTPEDDTIVQNNKALAVTFVGGEGRVLVIDMGEADSAMLMRAMTAAGIAADHRPPEALGDGLVFLSGYDAIVLANVPRWALLDDQDRMLHAYVHDLGGGLVMLGGPESFGAGGWIESETSKVLPVKLDPPQTRQMPRGALALIMHSCEMPQGNFWGQRVAIAAIEALSRLDYVGIVEYNWGARAGISGSSWVFPMQAGNKEGALAAAKTMTIGDMPTFNDSMELAYQGLLPLQAGQKHAIIISDGDPSPPTADLIARYKAAKITVTTVMVIGHGSQFDRDRMQAIADQTGGRFYHVINPNQLPQIFIKEAQMVSRSLIQEGEFSPQVVSRLPGPIEGFGAVPGIRGYVLTTFREGLTQTPIVHRTQEGDDPIYAHWNYGLGKSIAYTSDLMGRWGTQWVSWNQFQAFWAQSIRWVMRPSSPTNMIVTTRQEGDTAIVEVEALEGDASFLNFLQTRAVVLDPNSNAMPLSLQQTGPGRYRGEFRTSDPGSYLVNVNYTTPGGDEAAQGNLQAAITLPYAQEFRSVTHNAALLEQAAAMTGGRVLRATNPELLDLFYRGNLPVPKSPKAIWDLLAIIAATLFLIDVAARRLAVDPIWLRSLWGRAFGRRGEATDGTVAAWKKTREQVAHRREGGSVATTAKAKTATRSARFEAGEDDKAIAINVGSETPKDMTQKPADVKREVPKKDQPQDEGPHTSRLLKAKRRAQGESEEKKDHG